ncbi:uncharacterized protein GIQ15_01630 [Arthroderma uncinatum]|uniref:uncharacterized protein n=1 Tax=Arthroderma uncinatum TaxID=74035 RepID=UPI00144AF97C|nr:uncharacterized protein GIQ15_01630 [Arthroderma uncinatum]KAF3492113.1 hypothetical protein GIQ15_01630 [Arthroderma uncinatum]
MQQAQLQNPLAFLGIDPANSLTCVGKAFSKGRQYQALLYHSQFLDRPFNMTESLRRSTEYNMNISEEEARHSTKSAEASQTFRGKKREKPLTMNLPTDAEVAQLETSAESSQKANLNSILGLNLPNTVSGSCIVLDRGMI